MASTIAAVTTGGGGIVQTADASGNLSLLSGPNTIVAVTATGASVTGTLAVSGGVTLTTTLPVLQGGTGVTTSTGTGAGVHSVGPSISSAVMSTMASSVITSGTAVTSTSGTSIDFTGIPSWVKRITVMFNGVSTNGTSVVLMQIGTSGGVEVSGYLGSCSTILGTAPGANNFTTGWGVGADNIAASVKHGFLTIALLNTSSNLWACSGVVGASNEARASHTGGTKPLAATLDRVRITTVNGTDTFDAGSINILYE